MNKNITLNKRDGTIEEMTQETFSRWACLVEGIQAVDQKLVESNISDKDIKWVKPLAFEKYIQERFHSMLRDVEVEHELGNI
tara:strand:+ start:729 stop:974 length:246 start_codon:yes stop_codon:yes gene_type:complete